MLLLFRSQAPPFPYKFYYMNDSHILIINRN
nr:MAG TPA: hypothetical protein [Caudoviricetes sp.]